MDTAHARPFGTFDQFQHINPVVMAPSLVCGDGEVLMDATLILELAEALAAPRKSLMPAGLAERQHALCAIGLALAACEKSVPSPYERLLRPPEKRQEAWVTRVTSQRLAAYDGLESELKRRPLAFTSAGINQAGVSAAVAWQSTQQVVPEIVPAENYAALREVSGRAEALAEFSAAAHGASTYRPTE